jgi:hypothetical protein
VWGFSWRASARWCSWAASCRRVGPTWFHEKHPHRVGLFLAGLRPLVLMGGILPPVRSLPSPIEWNHPIAKGRQRPGGRGCQQQRDLLLPDGGQQVGQRLLLGLGKPGLGLINQ